MASKKRSKYKVDISKAGVKKRTSKDIRTGKEIVFDSLLEQKFYLNYIVPKFKSGEITDYELQRKYNLQKSFKRNGATIRAIDYVSDYWYIENGKEYVRDTKGGMVDSAAKIKRKLMWAKYPELDYEWIYYTESTGWIIWDEYEKIKRERKKAKKASGK